MKRSKKQVQARKQQIIEYLREHGDANVHTLAKLFAVTPTTIRRDLQSFEEQGYVQRSFGKASAKLLPPRKLELENPFGRISSAKMRIAQYAASLVKAGETLFVNSSTTALITVGFLRGITVTVITNNPRIINIRRSAGVGVIITGGELQGRKQSLVGAAANKALAEITVTRAILGVSGISARGGITSDIFPETEINRMMLHNAHTRIVVAEGCKIGRQRSFHSGDINEIDLLITDDTAPARELDALRACGLEIVVLENDAAEGGNQE
jgi:DeoR/GlpR family transcriptional regulator of sugar metabolism